MINKQHILDIANAHLEGKPFFITSLQVSPQNAVNISIDGDVLVSFEDCKALSRYISSKLDEQSENFSLEVGSHGATNPLTIMRQYPKHIGRTLEVKLRTNNIVQGTLKSCTDYGIELEFSERENKPVGNGKVTVTKNVIINHHNIKESKIKLNFKN